MNSIQPNPSQTPLPENRVPSRCSCFGHFFCTVLPQAWRSLRDRISARWKRIFSPSPPLQNETENKEIKSTVVLPIHTTTPKNLDLPPTHVEQKIFKIEQVTKNVLTDNPPMPAPLLPSLPPNLLMPDGTDLSTAYREIKDALQQAIAPFNAFLDHGTALTFLKAEQLAEACYALESARALLPALEANSQASTEINALITQLDTLLHDNRILQELTPLITEAKNALTSCSSTSSATSICNISLTELKHYSTELLTCYLKQLIFRHYFPFKGERHEEMYNENTKKAYERLIKYLPTRSIVLPRTYSPLSRLVPPPRPISKNERSSIDTLSRRNSSYVPPSVLKPYPSYIPYTPPPPSLSIDGICPIKNEGNTCYLNSLLHLLVDTPLLDRLPDQYEDPAVVRDYIERLKNTTLPQAERERLEGLQAKDRIRYHGLYQTVYAFKTDYLAEKNKADKKADHVKLGKRAREIMVILNKHEFLKGGHYAQEDCIEAFQFILELLTVTNNRITSSTLHINKTLKTLKPDPRHSQITKEKAEYCLLDLPVPSTTTSKKTSQSPVPTLQGLFAHNWNSKKSFTNWNLPNGATVKQFHTSIVLAKAPDIFVMSVKRFTADGQKNNTPIDIGDGTVDLTKWIEGLNPHERARYRISAGAIHSGSTRGGHYTAAVFKNGKHYLCNDSWISEEKQLSLAQGYVFVLERIKD